VARHHARVLPPGPGPGNGDRTSPHDPGRHNGSGPVRNEPNRTSGPRASPSRTSPRSASTGGCQTANRRRGRPPSPGTGSPRPSYVARTTRSPSQPEPSWPAWSPVTLPAAGSGYREGRSAARASPARTRL
jgi:hypothetical protein